MFAIADIHLLSSSKIHDMFNKSVEVRMTSRFLRLPEVKFRTGLSRSTIYQMIKDGRFPKQVPIGDRSVAWLDNQISKWIENLTSSAAPSENERKKR